VTFSASNLALSAFHSAAHSLAVLPAASAGEESAKMAMTAEHMTATKEVFIFKPQ